MTRVYLFADEFGNFDFRRKQGATEYFAVGSAMVTGETARAQIEVELARLRHDLIWDGHKLRQGFHACEDKQAVRDAVFSVIQRFSFKFDVTILEKCKAQPHLTANKFRFYQHAWFYHFRHIARSYLDHDDELVVVAASLGTKKERQAFTEAVSDVIIQCAPFVEHQVVSMPDNVEAGLQLADYCLWAVMRDVEGGDDRSRRHVEPHTRSEFQLFRNGSSRYY